MMNSEGTFLDISVDLLKEMNSVSQTAMVELRRSDPELLSFFDHREGSLPLDPKRASSSLPGCDIISSETGVLCHEMIKQGNNAERTVKQLVIPSSLKDDIVLSIRLVLFRPILQF